MVNPVGGSCSTPVNNIEVDIEVDDIEASEVTEESSSEESGSEESSSEVSGSEVSGSEVSGSEVSGSEESGSEVSNKNRNFEALNSKKNPFEALSVANGIERQEKICDVETEKLNNAGIPEKTMEVEVNVYEKMNPGYHLSESGRMKMERYLRQFLDFFSGGGIHLC